MNNGASIVLMTLAIGITLVALFAVMAALFSAAIARTRRSMEASAGASFAVGLVNTFFMGGIVAALAGLADGLDFALLRAPALALLVILIVLLMFGLAGSALMVGGRLFPERSATGQVLLGGTALVLACLTPFVGWFGLFPYVSFLGIGGFILSLFRKGADALPQADG
ncbi:MAG: hypothetical protein WBZ24_15970 [Anaerolineales bacterium]|jgi:hypothetical protein